MFCIEKRTFNIFLKAFRYNFELIAWCIPGNLFLFPVLEMKWR